MAYAQVSVGMGVNTAEYVLGKFCVHGLGLFQERLGVGEEFSEIYGCKQFGMPFNKNSTSEYAVMIAKECKLFFFPPFFLLLLK